MKQLYLKRNPIQFSNYPRQTVQFHCVHIPPLSGLCCQGIAITRGAAAALTFCYSVLLLTVCRNLISKMKELSLHQYIPLDSHIEVSTYR